MNVNKMRNLVLVSFIAIIGGSLSSCSSSSRVAPEYKLTDIEFLYEDGDGIAYSTTTLKEKIVIKNSNEAIQEYKVDPYTMKKGGYQFESENPEAFTLLTSPAYIYVPLTLNIGESGNDGIIMTTNKYPYSGKYVENDIVRSSFETIYTPGFSKSSTTIKIKVKTITTTYYATFKDIHSPNVVEVKGKFIRDSAVEAKLETTIEKIEEPIS